MVSNGDETTTGQASDDPSAPVTGPPPPEVRPYARPPDAGRSGTLGDESAEAARSKRGSGPPRWSSLWAWPAAVIALVALAGATFGPYAALLVAGEAIAILVFAAVAGTSGNRWIAAGVVVLIASVVTFIGLEQLDPTRLLAQLRGAVAADTHTGPRNDIVDLRGRDITQSHANEIDFRRAQLTGATFDGLDLRGRDLDGVDASGASFRGTDLAGASLRGTILRGACLRGARLRGADLTGADLTEADVSGADVSAAVTKTAAVWPHGRAAPTTCR